MSEILQSSSVIWSGNLPTHCDLCERPIGRVFVDGRTRAGHWASMCPGCHRTDGTGLGSMRGQCFEKQEDGSWLKTA